MSKLYKERAWDSVESTYRQEIYLVNGYRFLGYSKRVGMPEVKDKQILLQNWILRMYKAGYLDESNDRCHDAEKIEYYWKDNVKRNYKLAFTLYQDCFEWNEAPYRPPIDEFLKSFYKIKAKGLDPHELLYTHKKASPSDPLDLSKKRFYDKEVLQRFCMKLIRSNAQELGAVKAFYINYCDKHLDGYNQRADEWFFRTIHFG
ncbi:hypothetical protein [Reichenbachiella ulvae]|uniref:Uncharacterized protein n=1 Tax=Reichenbachiella ulvae TaxID=2980104 RepID=A0ABT3D019_9BACT|nr:hypothetical protein [Reichenbachiella ulvae]MCV9389159.1 hypothetical protein [Reichenbachiella ulvae]